MFSHQASRYYGNQAQSLLVLDVSLFVCFVVAEARVFCCVISRDPVAAPTPQHHLHTQPRAGANKAPPHTPVDFLSRSCHYCSLTHRGEKTSPYLFTRRLTSAGWPNLPPETTISSLLRWIQRSRRPSRLLWCLEKQQCVTLHTLGRAVFRDVYTIKPD